MKKLLMNLLCYVDILCIDQDVLVEVFNRTFLKIIK